MEQSYLEKLIETSKDESLSNAERIDAIRQFYDIVDHDKLIFENLGELEIDIINNHLYNIQMHEYEKIIRAFIENQ